MGGWVLEHTDGGGERDLTAHAKAMLHNSARSQMTCTTLTKYAYEEGKIFVSFATGPYMYPLTLSIRC